jgi:hypothetical protein
MTLQYPPSFKTCSSQPHHGLATTTLENMQQIIELVKANRVGQEITITELAAELNMS